MFKDFTTKEVKAGIFTLLIYWKGEELVALHLNRLDVWYLLWDRPACIKNSQDESDGKLFLKEVGSLLQYIHTIATNLSLKNNITVQINQIDNEQ